MDIFSGLTLLGGIAMFLFGMNLMGEGLEKRAGSQLKGILERMTSNPYRGFLLGLGVTAVIQSSTATTVMVVGFVNSGIMQLNQAIGIIMGANVGTTVTSWILSLSGIQGNSLFIQLLKPSSFSPVLAAVGVVFYMASGKHAKRKDTGTILLGFAVLMFGMDTMSQAVAPLADMPEFTNLLLMFSNPILGVVAGAVLTIIIQSSSASVGVLQALSSTGQVTVGAAVPIIMGQNIGTCVTAMVASVGANKNARRAAMVHLYFNVIGTFIFLMLFYTLKAVIGFTFIDDSINHVGIAIVHTTFNLVSTAIMLPFHKLLEKLAYMTIKDTEGSEEFQLLDERFLNTPTLAVQQCKIVTNAMAGLARDALFKAMWLTREFDQAEAEQVVLLEDRTDLYEDKLGTYLIKLSSRSLSVDDSREVSRLLHCIGDFERIGDHAVNILRVAEEIREKKIIFSDEANAELANVYGAVQEIVNLAVQSFEKRNLGVATQVEPLEEVIDLLKNQYKLHHVERLQKGLCTIEMGFVFNDLLTNYERVADHCSNIAVCIIQIENELFDTHEYLHEVKTSGNRQYLKMYEDYKSKYAL